MAPDSNARALDAAAAAGGPVLFAGWRFDPGTGTLSRRDAAGLWMPVSIGSRALGILEVLLRQPGVLVTKDALLDAVWPDVSVETNNLTVQIAALRRVLGQGTDGEGYIQTVTGRGYRFVAPIGAPSPVVEALAGPVPVRSRRTTLRRWIAGSAAVVALSLLALASHAWRAAKARPPLSVVILPFDAPDTGAGQAVAAGITDDLIARLVVMSGAVVIPRDESRRYRAGGKPATQIADDFGVRYVLTGSMRPIEQVLRVNAELDSIQDGGAIWIDQFDVPIGAAGNGQDAAEARLATGLVHSMVASEAARSRRERPDNPTADDLVLQARDILFRPPDPRLQAEARRLLERALLLAPSSATIRLDLANVLLDDNEMNPNGRKDVLERTRGLLTSIPAELQSSQAYRLARLRWLHWQDGRCRETAEAARLYIDTYPYLPAPYRWLAYCETQLGRADLAVPLLRKIIALQPQEGYQAANYRNLSYALFFLGRYDEAIEWGQRAIAASTSFGNFERARLLRWIAAAYALSGHQEEARRSLAEATRLWPYATLRGAVAYEPLSPIYAAQAERLREGLRLAGLRDHADEAAASGTPSSQGLSQFLAGLTPVGAPGATTILTADLVKLLAERAPLVIDTFFAAHGWSLPGAVGLRYVGEGGALSDDAQQRLQIKMRQLTGGERSRPIVAVGSNSEQYDGRNLALRLAALGYDQVYWYRGGREAWEVNSLPKADLVEQDW